MRLLNDTTQRVAAAIGACIAMAICSNHAHAAELTYDTLIFGESDHIGNKAACEPCNQFNPGLGFEVHDGGWLAGAGGYYDSYRQFAKMAFVGYEVRLPISANWFVGATLRAGYLNGSGFHNWAALPSLEVGYRRFALELTLLPAIHSYQTTVVALWGKVSF
jgi:hypothetical protein